MTGEVKPIVGEPLRFLVRSASDPKQWYLIDLQDDMDGQATFNGTCTCEQFQFRVAPKLKADKAAGRKGIRRRCKHLTSCLIYFGETMARAVAKENEKRRR